MITLDTRTRDPQANAVQTHLPKYEVMYNSVPRVPHIVGKGDRTYGPVNTLILRQKRNQLKPCRELTIICFEIHVETNMPSVGRT